MIDLGPYLVFDQAPSRCGCPAIRPIAANVYFQCTSTTWVFAPSALTKGRHKTIAERLAHPGAGEEFVRTFLNDTEVSVDLELGETVWSETGRRYSRYADRRRRSSSQEAKRMLADFLIGSHALLCADQLMTQDQSRYRRDFPELRLF